MTRSVTNQRGVSLMLLILAITVFAGVAIEVVMLLRTRHESYPYQVQSYQAYALAHAGVEFALGYANENAGSFQNYIPPPGDASNKAVYPYGNGKFTLRYKPGTTMTDCRDSLLSRGTCGTATREVELKNFSLYLGTNSNTVYMMGATLTNHCYGQIPSNCDANKNSPYSGLRIWFYFCDPSLLQPGAIKSTVLRDSITIAATRDGNNNQVKLLRLGFPWSGGGTINWVWDAACRRDAPLGSPITLPAWDSTNHKDPLSNELFQPTWNVNNPDLYNYSSDGDIDSKCRPSLATNLYDSAQPNYANRPRPESDYYYGGTSYFDNNATCPGSWWSTPVARSHATCYATTPMVEPWIGDACGSSCPPPLPLGDAFLWPGTAPGFFIETYSTATLALTPPVTFYVSFVHRPSPNVPGSEKRNVFKFTVTNLQ